MKKIWTVYKTTNKINGKYYIGVHKTLDPDDDYLGSGKYFTNAILKYGVENFEKKILAIFETPEEAFQMENTLVTFDLIESGMVYNLVPGGSGGWDNVLKILGYTREEWNKKVSPFCQEFANNLTDEQKEKIIKGGSKGRKFCFDNQLGWFNPEIRKKGIEKAASFESNEKRKNTFKLIEHQKGEKNSQYGTMWVSNLEEKISKRINKKQEIPVGWVKGRNKWRVN